MTFLSRRRFVQQSVAAASAWSVVPHAAALEAAAVSVAKLTIAPFRFDVTPPIGHPLCGGWIKPVVGVDDPLEAIGLVLLAAEQPIVLCAVDWTGLLNQSHVAWRTALADAAGTTADRVAVQCVHQHNAPFSCIDAERLVLEQGDLPHIVDLKFQQQCLDRARAAVRTALPSAQPVTHVAHGQASVARVASNRRVHRAEDGRVKAMRGSSCRDKMLRALPEGVIDPQLKTVAFYHGDRRIVAAHYYATHPMSYYGDGRVSSDFVGLARKQRQREDPDCTHIYFTGCAGNIAAGKYNDGSPELRPILADRVHAGIVAAEQSLQPVPVQQLLWRTVELRPTRPRSLSASELATQIGNQENTVVNRNRPAFMLSWLRRIERGLPIVLSSLRIDDVSLLHLPAECFVEYQLRAQQLQPSQFVATAAYGDGGPWYIPIRDEYPHGGYEVSVAFCDPGIDPALSDGIRALLA